MLIFVGNRLIEGRCIHRRKEGKRHLRSNATDGKQPLERIAIFFIEKAIEGHAILAHKKVCVEGDLHAWFVELIERGGRGKDAQTEAANPENHLIGSTCFQDAMNARNHRLSPRFFWNCLTRAFVLVVEPSGASSS